MTPMAGTGSTRYRWPPVRGVVMLEDVIEALIGEIRDATRRSPDRAGRRTGADGA